MDKCFLLLNGKTASPIFMIIRMQWAVTLYYRIGYLIPLFPRVNFWDETKLVGKARIQNT